MANQPRHPTPPGRPGFAQHRADDTERAKVREESHARGVAQEGADHDKKGVTRNDPQAQGNKDRVEAAEAQRKAERPNDPPLAEQVGMSSSELNTATPDMKKKATEQAQDQPGGAEVAKDRKEDK